MKTPPKEKEPLDRPTKNDWEGIWKLLNEGIEYHPYQLSEVLEQVQI